VVQVAGHVFSAWFGLLGAELNAARDAGEDHASGTEAGLAALAVEGAALDLFEPGTPGA
jgi:hypothetical protein